jgi:hypothetical protein
MSADCTPAKKVRLSGNGGAIVNTSSWLTREA